MPNSGSFLLDPRLEAELAEELLAITRLLEELLDGELLDLDELLELVAGEDELKLDDVLDELELEATTRLPSFEYCSIQS